jgi:GMP synthase-like glutamine amidotransferase
MIGRPRVVLVQNSPGSGPGRLPEWLAEEGIEAVVVSAPDLPNVPHPSVEAHPSAERPPVERANTRMELLAEAAGAADGLILLGGDLMPDDDERAPFLPRERALVGEALTTGVPVLGICLGAQLLALVAGGEVTARSGETERGSCPVELLPTAASDRLFSGLAGEGELRMIENHRDSITALPADAVHLATSQRCRVQAFRVGDAAWGVQFHPEASAGRVAEWDDDKVAADGFDKAALVAAAEADAATNAAQARALVAAFAEVVRGTGR